MNTQHAVIKKYEALLTQHGFTQDMPMGSHWRRVPRGQPVQHVEITTCKKQVRWSFSNNHTAHNGAAPWTLENFLEGKPQWWRK